MVAKWTPSPEWKDEDAFLIGGGSSLVSFPFATLAGKNTIGCNDAFRLGSEIVKICLFGDASFFHKNKFELEQSKCRMVTCAPALEPFVLPWMLYMERQKDGIGEGCRIGWNASTGAAALSLAFLLGATRIFLLGFDMGKRGDGKSHWHKHRLKVIQDESYLRFIRGFQTLDMSLRRFPHVRVFNVTDGSSKLPVFDRITFADLAKILETKKEQAA